MKLSVFCEQSAVLCTQSAAYAPALAADRSVAAVLRTAEPMAMAAVNGAWPGTVAEQAFVLPAPRIRFAPAASVIGSGHRTRLR